MIPLFRELSRDPQAPRTLIVVDETGVEPPQQFRIAPGKVFLAVGGSIFAVAVFLMLLVMLTPIRTIFLGPDPETLRETARANAVRVAALTDSLQLQQEYLVLLRATITGTLDTALVNGSGLDLADLDDIDDSSPMELDVDERTDDWEHHASPSLALARLDASPRADVLPSAAAAFVAGLQFPALPPVEGFFARGYDAARGHFGIDIAVDEDTPVRSIGDGYVIFADWTNDAGYVVAVQHADGYISIYKHNRRLLKRPGDRVRSREAVAQSGNTGEITTGPHLHFELWRNGLAQDPRHYLVGL